MSKESDEETFLINIPFLGYFFRKIKENKKAIKTLDTEKKIKYKTKIKDYLFGLIRIVSDKTVTLNEEKIKNKK